MDGNEVVELSLAVIEEVSRGKRKFFHGRELILGGVWLRGRRFDRKTRQTVPFSYPPRTKIGLILGIKAVKLVEKNEDHTPQAKVLNF